MNGTQAPQIPSNVLVENKISVLTMVYDTYSRFGKPMLEVNSNLGEYEFYRVVDPYTAHQELDMWLGGVLAYPPNFMVEIGDKDRIQAHGFDTKYGFRKRPAKRKL